VLLLTSTSDLIRIITSAAGAIDVHASFANYDPAQPVNDRVTLGRTNTASITTATTTTVVGFPGSGITRNVKALTISNEHASVTNTVTVEHFDGTNAETLWKGVLLPGEKVIFDAEGRWTALAANGVLKIANPDTFFGFSTAAQGPGFASDTYLTGSYIKFASGGPKVGTKYKCKFSASKTAAGTATPIITLRTGTLGTTGDTSRGTMTLSAGTAATDSGHFEITAQFRAVGSGTAAVLTAVLSLDSNPTTGFTSLLHSARIDASAGFDSTTADLGIGISVNGGTSAAWTVQLVAAEIENN
jgi:hypothetical protein